MTTIYFDVECIGSDDPAIVAEIAGTIKPPGNLKKQETIDKWIAEEKPAAVVEAVKKTCFDGALGKIVCIGWAVDNGAPVGAWGAQENVNIHAFFRAVHEAAKLHYHGGSTKTTPVFVGHNITGFDLRFLWQRCVCLGIKPPTVIPFKAKPWDASIADTMIMWNPERDKKIKLDSLCKALGVPTPKDGMDGSQVWDYIRAGRIEEVAAYCRGDVSAVRACYRRMMFLEADLLTNAA